MRTQNRKINSKGRPVQTKITTAYLSKKHIDLEQRSFFPSNACRQVVYQAGKTIAFCKFIELMQWQYTSRFVRVILAQGPC